MLRRAPGRVLHSPVAAKPCSTPGHAPDSQPRPLDPGPVSVHGPLSEADTLDGITRLKRSPNRSETKIAEAEAEAAPAAALKAAREAAARAESIEAAVYDLKAVNPNRKTEQDTRTPTELLDLIEVKGKEIAAALADLRSMCTSTDLGSRHAHEDVSRHPAWASSRCRILGKRYRLWPGKV